MSKWMKLIESSEEKFKDFYRFVFNFSTSSKTLLSDVAAALWKMLLKNKGYKHLDCWCKFIKVSYYMHTIHCEQDKHKKAVTKDLWNQFYDFIKTVKPDFSNYDANGAWPSAIDEFVTHHCEELKKTTSN